MQSPEEVHEKILKITHFTDVRLPFLSEETLKEIGEKIEADINFIRNIHPTNPHGRFIKLENYIYKDDLITVLFYDDSSIVVKINNEIVCHGYGQGLKQSFFEHLYIMVEMHYRNKEYRAREDFFKTDFDSSQLENFEEYTFFHDVLCTIFHCYRDGFIDKGLVAEVHKRLKDHYRMVRYGVRKRKPVHVRMLTSSCEGTPLKFHTVDRAIDKFRRKGGTDESIEEAS